MTSQTLSDMNSSVIEAKTFMEQASTMQLLESGTAPEILRVLKRSTVLNHSIIVNGYFRRELLVTPIPDIHHLIDIPPLIGGLLNLFYSDSYMAATLLLVIITKWSPQMKKLCIEQNGIDKICIFLMHHDHSHSAVHDALTCVVSLLQLAADPSDGTLISPYLKPALERHLEYQHKKYTHYIQTQQNPYFGNNFRGDEEQAILDAIQIIKKRL
eukprot:269462_1